MGVGVKVYRLVNQQVRQAACREIMEAPEGYVVKLTEPTRTLEQNALLWPLLACFSAQLQWPVNGSMTKLEPEEWKDILTAAFEQESLRIAQGLNGGAVMLGRRTSQYSKSRMSEFVEFLYAAGTERGVMFECQAERFSA